MKLNKKELIDMICQEVNLIKKSMIEEANAVSKSIPTLDVNMKPDGLELGSDKALVFKNTSKKSEKEGTKAPEVKMNANGSKLGSDEDAAVATEVKAGAKKTGSTVTAGQAKAEFTSKKDIQTVKASGPYDDRVGEINMNSQDKPTEKDVTKTYVTAGEVKGGNSQTAGQHKAIVHAKLPKEDAEEPTERIADGIEIDGSNIKLKESYTKSELKSFILSEAKKAADNYTASKNKISKKQELMNEIASLVKEMESCGYNKEEDLEEGMFDFMKKLTPEEKAAKELEKTKAKIALGKKYLEHPDNAAKLRFFNVNMKPKMDAEKIDKFYYYFADNAGKKLTSQEYKEDAPAKLLGFKNDGLYVSSDRAFSGQGLGTPAAE